MAKNKACERTLPAMPLLTCHSGPFCEKCRPKYLMVKDAFFTLFDSLFIPSFSPLYASLFPLHFSSFPLHSSLLTFNPSFAHCFNLFVISLCCYLCNSLSYHQICIPLLHVALPYHPIGTPRSQSET